MLFVFGVKLSASSIKELRLIMARLQLLGRSFPTPIVSTKGKHWRLSASFCCLWIWL